MRIARFRARFTGLLFTVVLFLATLATARQHLVEIQTSHNRWPDPEADCQASPLVWPALPNIIVQVLKDGAPVALVRTERGRDPETNTHLALAYVTLEPGTYSVRAWDMTGGSEVVAAAVRGRNDLHPGSITPPYGDFRLFIHDDSAYDGDYYKWDFRAIIGICPGAAVTGGNSPVIKSVDAPGVWIAEDTYQVEITYEDPDGDITWIQFLEVNPFEPGLRVFDEYDPGVSGSKEGIIYRNTGCTAIDFPPDFTSGKAGFLVRLRDSESNVGQNQFFYTCSRDPATITPPPGGYSMDGQWDTELGKLEASQSGDGVAGSFAMDGAEARFDGVLDGQTVFGTWSRAPSFGPPDDCGDLCLTIHPDGTEFMAVYRVGFTSDDWQTLSGRKSLWTGAIGLANNWFWLDWFGYFNVAHESWTYHQQNHWLHPIGDNPENIVFWDSGMEAFWWTSSSFYPFAFRFSDGCWLYYQKDSMDPRRFYNYCTLSWEEW
ncbi:hypothetical protein G0Q06_13255 [Puniceicoccales bacterium CK1056]|uniref:Uncharacterized protein n=1 Tax=Oceanipulchritudo coccoides TaxID=2706888 RepID=A0A6B2M5L8_9BACT|nr:hypothetical protein [Oceanipulchritudo coccoides]NDV63427.1 hypothetical protein [Oceanipulchritudo coccoides]